MKTRCYVGNITAAQNLKKRRNIKTQNLRTTAKSEKDDKNSLINIAMFDKTAMLLTGFFKE